MKPFKLGEKSCKKARVMERLDGRSHHVDDKEGTTYRRNRVHLRKTPEEPPIMMPDEFMDVLPEVEERHVDTARPSTPKQVQVPECRSPRRSGRTTKSNQTSTRTMWYPSELYELCEHWSCFMFLVLKHVLVGTIIFRIICSWVYEIGTFVKFHILSFLL